MPIKSIKAKEVLDSRRNPTIKVNLLTDKGLFIAMVPSGASTGKYEALELRDKDSKRYSGKGVLKAINNINKIIALKLINKNPKNQEQIDNLMIKLDNTKNKSNLGANAILAVSMAVCRAGAAEKNIPLYKHIQELSKTKKLKLPIPQLNIINGGRHAGIKNDIQEHMIMPVKAKSFKQAMQMSLKTFQALKSLIKKEFKIKKILIGDEGGFVLKIKSVEQRLELILRAIEKAGYKPGKEIFLALDSAASEFYKNKIYTLNSKKYNSIQLIEFYKNLINEFPIISIEDSFDQDDWQSFKKLTKKLGNKIQITGDDLLVTNSQKIKKAIKLKAVNSVLIKINQIGTITETIKAINLTKKNNFTSVISHRSGETKDSFIADLAVGTASSQIKSGAPNKPERLAKYNRIMEIEKELGGKGVYGGKDF